MSEDVRAFSVPSLGGVGLLEVHSQRQLVFCQNFPLRALVYHDGFAAQHDP
jgi:hypothetical protein